MNRETLRSIHALEVEMHLEITFIEKQSISF